MSANIVYRIGGLICMATAAVFGRFFIWLPLLAAQAHEAKVEYNVKIFVLVPFAAVFGLFFLIFGDKVPYRNVEKQTFTAAGWLLFLVATVASGLSFWWFKAQFDALGYGY
jgi:hypothetical protein